MSFKDDDDDDDDDDVEFVEFDIVDFVESFETDIFNDSINERHYLISVGSCGELDRRRRGDLVVSERR